MTRPTIRPGTIILYLLLIYGAFTGVKNLILTIEWNQAARHIDSSYHQPEMESAPWSVRSIDTQIISKHWRNVPRESIKEQVALLKGLGANYIAISTPYDHADELATWAHEAHAQHLRIWYRSHWLAWEGDENTPPIMTPQEYLDRTYDFIVHHPDLYQQGDAMTAAVEAEQVGVGWGRRFRDWDDYRGFLVREVNITGDAMRAIGMGGQVHTNWLSMNGWIAENQITPELASELGLLVVDHYPPQGDTDAADDPVAMAAVMKADLNRFYDKLHIPILIGEWGYPIHREVGDPKQTVMIAAMYDVISQNPHVVGVNYWPHAGNTARLFTDTQGSNFKPRTASKVVKETFVRMSKSQ